MNKVPILAIVVPCFNEEAVLKKTILELIKIVDLMQKAGQVASNSFILFVDDGSTDLTWQKIAHATKQNKMIKGLKLSRNFGHQQALIAGLSSSKENAQIVVTLDADLQDDPNIIQQFVDKYKSGAEIVYGVRRERAKDSYFKRSSAQYFYKFMKFLGVEITYNHADYRLMSKKAIDALMQFEETNLFLRGIVPLVGFSSATVWYNRNKRESGETKYPTTKMLSFAAEAITSFSIKPLRIITVTGFAIFVGSLFAGVWVVAELLRNNVVHGWASTVLPIYFIGGIQILSIGIIGEYLGKVYKEVKKRPRYIIEEKL